jgi:hypothetical protein
VDTTSPFHLIMAAHAVSEIFFNITINISGCMALNGKINDELEVAMV